MTPPLLVRLSFLFLAAGLAGASQAQAQAPARHPLPVRIGSCSAQLISADPWVANADGTYSNSNRQAILIPDGTRLQLPMLASGPIRINPLSLRFPLDARLLPLPRDGVFGELLASSMGAGPVSAGIDTGANIRKLAPNLFLEPNTSYVYFTTLNPFSINLNKKNKSIASRQAPKGSKKSPKVRTMGFAMDPCDPSVFFGGVTVNINGITATLDGMGFSQKGKIQHRSAMPIWTGRTLGNGEPQLGPEILNGHAYLKGTIGVGMGSFLSLTGTAAVTVNLDPRRNGVWGLQEALAMFKGRMPQTLPDFRVLVEGSPQLTLPMMSIPFARLALAIDATNPRSVKLRLAGERSSGAKLSDLFTAKIPGADLITAKGSIQIFANASFDATARMVNGSYAIKVRGLMEVGLLRVSGDVDISYRVGGLPQVCVKLPGMGRLCGREIERAAAQAGRTVVRTTKDAVKTVKTVAKAIPSKCPAGFSKAGVACMSNSCPHGMRRRGALCVSKCPPNSNYSGTGAHCMTRTKRSNEKSFTVNVGNFKKKKKYVKACTKRGARYTHDLLGFAYCVKGGGCPSGYPTRRGSSCHASCSPLSTDAFGNCPVRTQVPATRPFQR